jgi:predicted AlkP superfamily pyrophosphatase or phosphodiesterase
MKTTLAIASALALLPLFSQAQQPAKAPQTADRPKLVVGIVVDQMRWDFLYRYADRYEAGGFKRLLGEGFTCENTMITHLPSYTAVGHTVIFTGSVPAIDGITGNDWIDINTGRHWYCTEDTTVQSVGTTSSAGKMSPRNLRVTTITDELRLASNFRSKVVGVSLKDRASILPAGHMPNGAFWLDDSNASFVTSSFYMNDLPEWVKKFNDTKEPAKLMSAPWQTLYPIASYVQSTQDNVAWEGTSRDEKAPVFPHDLPAFFAKGAGAIRPTPFGNTLTLDFAKAAIDGEQLGKGPATDFLTINCASTDYVGHQYGPNSIEVEDTYLRLDKDLASFFKYLDQKVGKGNYLVFLSADHGVSHTVGFNKEHGLSAGLVKENHIIDTLNQFLNKRFGVDKVAQTLMNYHVVYDMKQINDNKLDYNKVKQASVQFLQTLDGITFAVDIDHIGESAIPEPIKTMVANGYDPKRTGPVMVIPDAGWFEGTVEKGTTHGNWNPYDTHIPLVFMGWHIKHGSSNEVVSQADISPTLAALLHIQMPSGAVGKPIKDVIGK